MHQPFDEPPEDFCAHQVAMAWCLVQEGFADFRLNRRTGQYDFALTGRGKEAHRRSMEHYGEGRDIAGDLDTGDNY